MRQFLLSVLCCTFFISATSQQNHHFQFFLGTYLSTTNKTTFWQRTNQSGTIPLESQFLTIGGKINKDFDSTVHESHHVNKYGMNYTQNKLNKFGWGYGINLIGNIGKKSGLYIPEIYGKVRFGAFEFYGGRRREIFGLVDTTLTMGSVIWSENAMPLPKIQISIPNYIPIVGRGLISVKGGYAHGWFGKQDYVENYYLHQKWLYAKIGRKNWKINLFGGVNHQVQWGGYSEILKNDSFSSKNGYFSDDFFVYKNIVLPISIWKFPANATYTPYETLNRFGNHLGSFDMGFKVFQKAFDIEFYRQVPYEDGQLPEVFLSADGNYTLSLTSKKQSYLKKISLGYLDTRRQGGEITKFAEWVGKKETHPNETQNYFNHGQYFDGWSYQDFGIGTPFIMGSGFSNLIPQAQNQFSFNNRVQVFYFALSGELKKLKYNFRNSYSSNLGTFNTPFIPTIHQISTILTTQLPITNKNIIFSSSFSSDFGEFLGNNLGLSFSVSKKW